jgi:hypothetical protein
LTIVNELDVVRHDAALTKRYGDYVRSVFASWAGVASLEVIAEARHVLCF